MYKIELQLKFTPKNDVSSYVWNAIRFKRERCAMYPLSNKLSPLILTSNSFAQFHGAAKA
jgi:hypothetical protein